MATRTPAASEEQGGGAQGELSTLRSILFGDDRERLEELSRRIRERQIRADDVAEVLPDAFVREFARSPQRLKEAVRQPIEETLREAVRNDPRPIADAIFPVIGPAIRRYITASIRALAQSLSRTIERGLSPRRQLAWRYKAWRSGLSFGQYVLQRTFVYRVEHVYLIQAGSGLLIGEAHHDDSPVMDSDAISGMLSALQAFVLDSFELEEGHQLQTADLGDFTLWAIHGPYAMLACAIRGAPGADLRDRLEAALERMHLRHARYLERFDGDGMAVPHELEEELDRCLYREHADDLPSTRRIGWQTWLLLVLLVGFAVRMAGLQLDHVLARGRLVDVLEQTQGIVLTGVERRGGEWQVYGLRDPLAPSLGELAAEARVGERAVADRLEPYQSLDAQIVLRRISRALGQPDSVELRLQRGVLYVRGTADPAWVERIASLALLSPAVERVDLSALRVSDAALLASARELLQPPAGIVLHVDEGVLGAQGTAPLDWLTTARERTADIAGLRGSDFAGVEVAELRRARSLVTAISSRRLLFERGSARYREDAEALVRRSAAEIVELAGLARMLQRPLLVQTVGHTDAAGDEQTNAALRRARAERVREDLVRLGVPAELVEVRAAPAAPDTDTDPELRRTEIRPLLDLSPYDMQPRR